MRGHTALDRLPDEVFWRSAEHRDGLAGAVRRDFQFGRLAAQTPVVDRNHVSVTEGI
jgi:hypothetical protein